MIPRTTAGRLMLAGRLGFGGAFFGAPRAGMRAVGVGDSPDAAHWARVFGIRDVALGVGLLASSGDARRVWWRIGMLCDAGDAAAALISHRRGELPSRGLFAGSALVGVALGATALAQQDD